MFKLKKIYFKIVIFFFVSISFAVSEEIKIAEHDWSSKGIT